MELALDRCRWWKLLVEPVLPGPQGEHSAEAAEVPQTRQVSRTQGLVVWGRLVMVRLAAFAEVAQGEREGRLLASP